MNAIVDPVRCDGCGLCEDLCPAVFQIAGYEARVRVHEIPPDAEEQCQKAAQECPATAICIEA
jgi:ferredoxin